MEVCMSTARSGRLRQAAQTNARRVAPSGINHHSSADTDRHLLST
jgi:hypothetical protein